MTTRENTPAKRRKIADNIAKDLGRLLGQPLTRRERDVVRAVLAGAVTEKDLGQALSLEGSTVRAHLYHIFTKTGAINLADLVLMAVGRKPSVVDLGDTDGTR
jgi:DNA-binding CsgD family transcriptional regulator